MRWGQRCSQRLAGRHRQTGLSLVELLVAMLIGSVVLLAATEVLRHVHQLDQRTRQLAERQAAVVYVLDVMAARLRSGVADETSFELRDSGSAGTCTLYDRDGRQPLIDGLASSGNCEDERPVESLGEGIYRLHLMLPDFPAPLSLWVVDRRQWSSGGVP